MCFLWVFIIYLNDLHKNAHPHIIGTCCICANYAELMIQIREDKFKDTEDVAYLVISPFLLTLTYATLFSVLLLHKHLFILQPPFRILFLFSIKFPIFHFSWPCFWLSVPSLSALPRLHSLFLCSLSRFPLHFPHF